MSPADAPPVFLLTTTGRRTNRPRTVPLSYLTEDAASIVVGTNGGLPIDPAWILNLRNNPQALVQIGRDRIPVRAEFVDRAEADGLWKRIIAEYPIYRDALASANRDVPIVRLFPEAEFLSIDASRRLRE